MLGKVMKYELRSCGRMLLPFFGVALVLSGIARLALWAAPLIWAPLGRVLTSLAGSLGILALFAVILLTFVYIVVRFYQGMVAGEATLSFTLPVSVTTHLVARLLVGILYCVASCVVVAACALIFIPGFFEIFATASLPVTVNGTAVSVPLSGIPAGILWSLLGIIVVCMLIAIITNLLYIYISFAVGGLFTKNRILGGIVAYLVINNVEGLLSMVFALPFMFNIGRTNAEINAYIQSLVSSDVFATVYNILGFVWLMVAVIAAVNLLFSVIHFFVTRYIYTKKLNLE